MAKDYAKYKTYQGPRSRRGWLWLMLGLVLVLFLFGLFFLKGHNKQEIAQQTADKLTKKILENPVPKSPEPKFDFYNILPQDNLTLPAQAMDDVVLFSTDPSMTVVDKTTSDPSHFKKTLNNLLETTPEQLAIAEAKKQLDQEMSQLNNNTYLLVLGNFQDVSQAEQYQAQALLKGFPVQKKVNKGNGGTSYQLFMGPYSGLAVASQAQKRLNMAGMQAALLRERLQNAR
jgi:cell division protein FtsN